MGVGARADRDGVDVVGGQQLLDRPDRRADRRRDALGRGRYGVGHRGHDPARAPRGPAARRASGRSGRSRSRRSAGPAAPVRCRPRIPRPLLRSHSVTHSPVSCEVTMASRTLAEATASSRVASSAASPEIALHEVAGLDDLGVVVAHRDAGARLERGVLAVAGLAEDGAGRLAGVLVAGRDLELARAAEVPSHQAAGAVHLEGVVVLLPHRRPVGLADAERRRRPSGGWRRRSPRSRPRRR